MLGWVSATCTLMIAESALRCTATERPIRDRWVKNYAELSRVGSRVGSANASDALLQSIVKQHFLRGSS